MSRRRAFGARRVRPTAAVVLLAAGTALAWGGGGLAAGTAARPATTPTTVTVTAVGDTMMGSPPWGLPPDRGRTLFSAVKKDLVGNVVIVDQEGTFTTTGPSKCGRASTSCFAFRSPPSFAANLTAAGFTVANLADNHTHDFGAVGLTNTVRALTRARLPYTGLPGQFTIRHVGSLRVAVLGFAPYTWCANSLDLPAVRALIGRAHREASLVVVYFHAGTQGAGAVHTRPGPEYVDGDPQGDVIAFAHAAVSAGADMVLGTGPHVLRGIQFWHGHLIAYSLGNFLGYKGFGLGGTLSTSAVLQVTVSPTGRFLQARLRPVELNSVGVPSPGGRGIALIRALSREDFGGTSARISSTGVISAPAG